MLSKEITEAIEMLKQSKAAGAGVETTAESALEDRARIDSILGAIPQSKNVENTSDINEVGFSGQFYTYNSKDPEKMGENVLLFIHGGGFMNGSVLSRRKLCQDIMDQVKIDALSVEYGQWPETHHPTALDNCVSAYKWLLKKGYDSKKIYIFGESAGAMLTLTMNMYIKDNNLPQPGKCLVFSPVAGQEMDLDSHKTRDARDPMISYTPIIPYYENADFKSPYVSPALGDFTNFPKLAIHVGSEEVLYDDAHLVYNLCKEKGVDVSIRVWDGLFHVFPLFKSPETDMAIKEIGAFFKE